MWRLQPFHLSLSSDNVYRRSSNWRYTNLQKQDLTTLTPDELAVADVPSEKPEVTADAAQSDIPTSQGRTTQLIPLTICLPIDNDIIFITAAENKTIQPVILLAMEPLSTRCRRIGCKRWLTFYLPIINNISCFFCNNYYLPCVFRLILITYLLLN